MDKIIHGKTWVGRDDIMVYEIIAMNRWDMDNVDPEELGKWAFEGVDKEFSGNENAFKNKGCSIVVAGVNFGGGGKSIEHPVFTLKGAGVKVVLAESFARFNFRNSVNNGLPVFVCPGILKFAKNGDELAVDTEKGLVKNERIGETIKISPLPAFAMDLINAGGLIPYTWEKLHSKK
jgi:3-isopropylmalate/(R)-2-methylmalate dehydratase small subunit